MVIPVNTEIKDLIKAYILCYNPILKLKPREIDVLEAMLKVYFNLKKAVKTGTIKLEEIDKRLNDPMGRKVIRDLIKMSEASYNNHYVQLKKKRVITKDDKLETFLKNLDSENLSITYKINIIKPKPEVKLETKPLTIKTNKIVTDKQLGTKTVTIE